MSLMKRIIIKPMTQENEAAAISSPKTRVRFFKDRCLATSVLVIGVIMGPANPTRTPNIRNRMKFGARPRPNNERLNMRRPAMSRDLCLNLTLSRPMSRAERNAAIEPAVPICPVTPTGSPKVSPISIRRSVIIIPGGIVAKRLSTMEGRNNHPTDLVSSV